MKARLPLKLGSDAAIYAVCLAALGGVVAALVLDVGASQAKVVRGEAIAKVERFSNTVRTRPATLPVWDEIHGEQSLYQRDHLFTGDGATAEVVLSRDDTRLTVQQNSLVIIESEQQSSVLDIKKGLVYIVSGKDDGEVTFKVNGVEGKVKGKKSEAVINVNRDGSTDVVVLKGQASLGQGAKAVRLETLQKSRVAADGAVAAAKPMAAALATPAWNADVVVKKEDAGVDFSWDVQTPLRDVVLEVARDSDFAQVVRRQPVSGAKAKLSDLPAGELYWRVQGVRQDNGEREFSDARRVNVVRFRPPQIVRPADGETFQYLGGAAAGARPPKVFVDWDAVASAVAYDVEIAKDQTFKTKTRASQPTRSPVLVEGLVEGRYFLRMRSRYAGAETSAWSESVAFSVSPIPPLGAVAVESPGDEHVVRLDKQPAAVAFVVSPPAEFKTLHVEISREASFAKLVSDVKQSQRTATWSPKEPGEYFWRTRIEDVYGRASPYSPARKLIAMLTPAELATPDDQAVIAAKAPASARTFRWEKVAGATAYVIEIAPAKGGGFDGAVVKQSTKGTSFVWDAPAAGAYRWRVLAQLGGGAQPLPSETRSVTVQSRPKLAPPKLDDRKDVQIEPGSGQDGGWNWHDWLFPVAYAAGADAGRARLTWPAVEGAAGYRLQIASDKGFTAILLDRKVDVPRYVWEDPKPGRYYYRVAAFDDDGVESEFSNASELNLTLPPPALASPAGGTTLALPDDGVVTFRWRELPGDLAYVVEVGRGGDFAKPITSDQTSGSAAKVRLPAPGRYAWRVRALVEGDSASVSEARTLIVEKKKPEPPSAAASLLSPSDDTKLKLEPGVAATNVRLSWSAVPRATQYGVQISSSPNFSVGVTTLKSTSTSTDASLPAGTYAWRVVAMGADGTSGPQSRVGRFQVVRAEPPPPPETPKPAPAPPPEKPKPEPEPAPEKPKPAPVDVARNKPQPNGPTGYSYVYAGSSVALVEYATSSPYLQRQVDGTADLAGVIRGQGWFSQRFGAAARVIGHRVKVEDKDVTRTSGNLDVAVRWPLLDQRLSISPTIGFARLDALVFERSDDGEETGVETTGVNAPTAGLRLLGSSGRFSAQLGGYYAHPAAGGATLLAAWRIAGRLALGVAYDYEARFYDDAHKPGGVELNGAVVDDVVHYVSGMVGWSL